MKLIQTHRFVFISAWLLGVIGLLVYPGYEARAFVMAGIIGYWPFALLGVVDGPMILFLMFALSVLEIGLCAWFMDRSHVPKKICAVLLFAIVVGMSVTYLIAIGDFEKWKHGLVSYACHPDYELTLSDFYRLYVIPNMLSMGVWMIYLTMIVGFGYALCLRVCGKRQE